MRRGWKPKLVIDKSKQTLKTNNNQPKLLGVNCAGDACAEHEIGIGKMREAFGCNLEGEPGLARRIICNTMTHDFVFVDDGMQRVEVPLLSYFEDDCYAVLLANVPRLVKGIQEQLDKGMTLTELIEGSKITSELRPPFSRDDIDEWEISAAWDEGTFGLLVPKKSAHLLIELKEHFDNKNIILMLGAGMDPFKDGGLNIIIADRLPKAFAEEWRKKDIDKDKLKAREEELNARGMLRETWKHPNEDRSIMSGCSGYLGAEWAEGTHLENETEYDLVYFLNPHGQEDNYWGLVTLEDLKQWMLGRGKIPGGGRNPSPKIKALSDNEDACYHWMIDRLTKDGCPQEEAEKYSFNQFIYDFYDDDWEQFVEDAVESSEHLNLK